MNKVNFEELHSILSKQYENHRIEFISMLVCTCGKEGKEYKSFMLVYSGPKEYDKGKLKVITQKATKDKDIKKLIVSFKKAMTRKRDSCDEIHDG